MFYRTTRTSTFGTDLDTDGRTVFGDAVTVGAGALVELVSVGALDMVLVKKQLQSLSLPVYCWVFLSDLEEIKEAEDGWLVTFEAASGIETYVMTTNLIESAFPKLGPFLRSPHEKIVEIVFECSGSTITINPKG